MLTCVHSYIGVLLGRCVGRIGALRYLGCADANNGMLLLASSFPSPHCYCTCLVGPLTYVASCIERSLWNCGCSGGALQMSLD